MKAGSKTEETESLLPRQTSPLAATCATDVGFSLPNPFHPAALPSLIRATDCTLPKSDARILSHCHCTLVNMSKVGRAPWTHMSHFLDMSHCALNSLPLCSFMAFLWGHFSATIRDVTDSCSKGRSHTEIPQTLLIPRTLHFGRGECIVHHSVGLSPVEKAGAECTWGAPAVRGEGTLAPWCIDRVQTERRARQLPQP